MSIIIINPGSGPVAGASYEHAVDNIAAFAREVGAESWKTKGKEATDGDGRWAFTLHRDGKSAEIEMPGLPLDRVRYVKDEQNIWDFPRLYVNGSSWVWLYALDVVWRKEEA